MGEPIDGLRGVTCMKDPKNYSSDIVEDLTISSSQSSEIASFEIRPTDPSGSLTS